MPAHKSASAIGTCIGSDGNFVTAIDWRANRLVDYFAKLAARVHCVPDLASTLFKQAMHAAEYCAAFLGTVTHKANHHKVLLTKPNGLQAHTFCRDSAPGKRPSKVSVAHIRGLQISIWEVALASLTTKKVLPSHEQTSSRESEVLRDTVLPTLPVEPGVPGTYRSSWGCLHRLLLYLRRRFGRGLPTCVAQKYC